jgi:serine/threonine-protein kinase ATR
LANVPLYIFFIVFAQLTARVLHPTTSIHTLIRKILMRLICEYREQTMWLLMRSYHSNNPSRKTCIRAMISKVLADSRDNHHQPQLRKFIVDMVRFAELMTCMAQKDVQRGQRVRSGVRHLQFSKDFPELHRLFDRTDSDFSQILLPFRSLVNVTLPKSTHEQHYQLFAAKDVYIYKFEDTIELLHSLQRPKKIAIVGSDGKRYTILCKPNDDLRKDYCFLEFCNLLNRCFKRDSEARRRQLRVNTYLVVSLSDTCGLIEWIPGLTPFRTLVEGQYGLVMNYEAIKKDVTLNYPPHTLPKTERVKRFQSYILPKFMPSVFGNWFASTYSDPLSWFAARLAYTRSSAVFSVVGYLLGLGDRHGENILIEEASGETVHVDLNCMFNKGEDFQVPERVPFRLTHNMVHAMGVTEFEGTFRKACEHTLRVVRENKEAVMNFVTPFRYDHLNEWKGNGDLRQTSVEFTIDTVISFVF